LASIFSRTKTAERVEDLCVPDKIVRRARQVPFGTEPTWIDQTLYLIGSNATHHEPGGPLLREAITSAQALLALLVEMDRREFR
jgi:hypothetical protein